MLLKALYVVVCLAALLLGLAVYSQFTKIKPTEIRLPEFSFADTEGHQRNSHEWSGKVIILNFWASWCGPCREEIPLLIDLKNSYQDDNVQLIGIAIEETEPAHEYAQSIGINYPILIGERGGMSLAYHLGNVVNAVPFTAVIDRDGTLVYQRAGLIKKARVTKVIEALIGVNLSAS